MEAAAHNGRKSCTSLTLFVTRACGQAADMLKQEIVLAVVRSIGTKDSVYHSVFRPQTVTR